ncbi:Cytoplasmic polyadenylation element-binding protein 3 [Varanus komodoensis]|nr:Cytoplasmic polyadenylation element-binding protein 3 [Varanus komodoensis]
MTIRVEPPTKSILVLSGLNFSILALIQSIVVARHQFSTLTVSPADAEKDRNRPYDTFNLHSLENSLMDMIRTDHEPLKEHIMRKAGLDESPVGIMIAGRNINNLRYADDTTLMAESEEELKSLFMRVKEESAKAGLKLNIKKTKIMASGPLTSWQIDGEEMERVLQHRKKQVIIDTFFTKIDPAAKTQREETPERVLPNVLMERDSPSKQ